MRGFVDLQVNGFRGVDFAAPDLEEDAVVAAVRGLIADGTAVLLPTLVTSTLEVYARNLPILARVCSGPEFAPHVPGFHLEGPFLSGRSGYAGAHDPDRMRAGDPALLDRLQRQAGGMIRMLTVAPEIEGAPALIRHARSLGITVSLGHSAGEECHFDTAVAAGATALTHLGNGLPHLVDRHRNPLLCGLADDRLSACVIGDGHHLPWSLLHVILRVKGGGRSILVSDASPLAGLPPGRYTCFGGPAVIHPDGRLCNPDTGFLAGSSMTIRQVVNATRTALGLGDAQLHAMAVVNPLRLIGHGMADGIATLPRGVDGSWLAAAVP
ncbi:MAG: N-acetylglucosamine-6-phosphate deacetylase [Planctomycetes bacterium]|nr:N-acetylglucosamine-6-phosphate deacetylase [Planctomycetota bacterium]